MITLINDQLLGLKGPLLHSLLKHWGGTPLANQASSTLVETKTDLKQMLYADEQVGTCHAPMNVQIICPFEPPQYSATTLENSF